MVIEIKSITQEDYFDLVDKLKLKLPIWIQPSSVVCYKEKEILTVFRNNNLVGLYVLPIRIFNGYRIIERTYRYFPFLSPIIFENDLERRRNIVIELFKYIFKKYDGMYMPFSPEFKDIAGIAELGAFFECRHTQMIKKKLTFESMNAKLRNHIKKAISMIEVRIESDIKTFNFNLAIKGDEMERELRMQNAANLLKCNSAKIINAYLDNQIVAGIFICYDKETTTYLHSWQNADTPRGTISYLLMTAINLSFDEFKTKQFDLEGSVMFSIDKFFNNFNGEYVLYPYLHFAKDYKLFEMLVNISKDIPGRVSENFGGLNE